MEDQQTEIRRQLDTIVTALIVTEPRTGLAAEAFDGLRRNIAFAAQERRRQLSQLVAFADAIDRGATIETLQARCEQWCAEAGLRRYTDPATQPDWFQVVEGEGPTVEVIDPAWIDAANGVLVKQGTARRIPADEPAVTPAPPSVPGPLSPVADESEPEPTEEPPAESAVEPAGSDADAAEGSAEPAGSDADAAEGSVEPADSAVEPADGAVEEKR